MLLGLAIILMINNAYSNPVGIAAISDNELLIQVSYYSYNVILII